MADSSIVSKLHTSNKYVFLDSKCTKTILTKVTSLVGLLWRPISLGLISRNSQVLVLNSPKFSSVRRLIIARLSLFWPQNSHLCGSPRLTWKVLGSRTWLVLPGSFAIVFQTIVSNFDLQTTVGPVIFRNVCGHVTPALIDIMALDSIVSLTDIIIVHHTGML